MATAASPTFELTFEADVVEYQRLLNGSLYAVLEGMAETGDAVWALSLSLTRARELDAPVEEGELVLLLPGGDEAYATVTGGTADEDPDDPEMLTFAVRCSVVGGTGRFEAAGGTCTLEFSLTPRHATGKGVLTLQG